MTQQPECTVCSGCGIQHPLKKSTDGLCPACVSVLDAVRTHPGLQSRIAALLPAKNTSAHAHSEDQTQSTPRELPEVLNAVRFRTRDREQNTWYVSVSELEGNPVEIFASTAFDRDQHLQSRISNLTTITRLISLILRHIFLEEALTLEKALKQLHRSSRQKNDLPDMLTRVLCNYCKEPYKFDS